MDVFPIREQEFLNSSSEVPRYQIRVAQPQDLFEISEILASSFPLHLPWLQWMSPVIRMGIHEDLRSRLRSAPTNYTCLVAIDPRRSTTQSEYIAGTVEVGLRHIHSWQLSASRSIYLSNLAVREDVRRQGVARQLLRSCDRIVADWGFRQIYLHVLETNQAAQQLYLQHGYGIQEAQMGWGLMRGQPKRLLMRKII